MVCVCTGWSGVEPSEVLPGSEVKGRAIAMMRLALLIASRSSFSGSDEPGKVCSSSSSESINAPSASVSL